MRWDRLSVSALTRVQDELVAAQVSELIAPASPLWRERLASSDRTPETLRTAADLATVPALGERDVSPDGSPAGMARLVLQASERDFAISAPGPRLRGALRTRLGNRQAYRRLIDADTRATSYVFGGLGFRYPIASTRSDLDGITRAGARLWSVLGLTREDVLVSALPVGASPEHQALQLAALGAGAPALFPGGDPVAVAATIRLAPPTVLAVATESATELLTALDTLDVELADLRTLLLVGAPSDPQRQAAAAALVASGANHAVVLGVHIPAGGRLMWGECRQSSGRTGLHTYPDLDLVQTVDADTGDLAATGVGELVLTQLGMRGSALFRWRTGDVVAAIETEPCPACRRRVPRLIDVRAGALVVDLAQRRVDLRALGKALVARTHLADWRIVVGRRARDGERQVVVHIAGTDDESQLIVAAATDLRDVAGMLPTQLVVGSRADLDQLPGRSLGGRILLAD